MFNQFINISKEMSEEISDELMKLGRIIGKVDQIFIWRNYYKTAEKELLYKEQLYEWNRKNETTDCTKITNKLENVFLPPELEDAMRKDIPIYDIVKDMTDVYSKSLLEENNVLATLMVSIFVNGELWGCLSLDNCTTEEDWSNYEISIVKDFGKKLGNLIEKFIFLDEIKTHF